MKKILILTLLAVVFTGCSSDNENKDESLSYEFSYNGCSTGRHEFNSKAAMCEGLQDDDLNNYCAIGMRASHFDANCPGKTFVASSKKGPQGGLGGAGGQGGFGGEQGGLGGGQQGGVQTQSGGVPEVEQVQVAAADPQNDELVGDTLVRSITAGSASLVLYKNPTGESASSMVFCAADAKSAKALFANAEMGGMVLTKGTKIILKNDQSKTFSDGTSLKGTYIQIECK